MMRKHNNDMNPTALIEKNINSLHIRSGSATKMITLSATNKSAGIAIQIGRKLRYINAVYHRRHISAQPSMMDSGGLEITKISTNLPEGFSSAM